MKKFLAIFVTALMAFSLAAILAAANDGNGRWDRGSNNDRNWGDTDRWGQRGDRDRDWGDRHWDRDRDWNGYRYSRYPGYGYGYGYNYPYSYGYGVGGYPSYYGYGYNYPWGYRSTIGYTSSYYNPYSYGNYYPGYYW